MAVPFRRTSTTSKKKRRWPKELAFQKLVLNKSLVLCLNCKEKKVLHRVCQRCQEYKKF